MDLIFSIGTKLIEILSSRLEPTSMGYETLAKLNLDLKDQPSGNVDVSFHNVTWVDAHLASAMKVIVNHAYLRGQAITLHGLSPNIRTILKKNHFLNEPMTDTYGTTMPSTGFQQTAEKEFANYTRKHLNHQSMPRMTETLKRKFYEGIDELFANSALHSKTISEICVCGQFYPRKELLCFVISDGGQGIAGGYQATFNERINHCDAINWAMVPDNTTRVGDIPGGLGLGILREFINLNKGKLIVASEAGYWCQNGAVVETTDLRYPYPGTSIVMEIDCSDKKSYELDTITNPHDIW